MDAKNGASGNLHMRQVLQKYEQQLLTARRLAKFRAKIQAREGEEIREPDPSVKRRMYVEKMASEMLSAIVFTGVPSAIMEEIRQELGQLFNKDFEFVFPPDSNLCIYVRDGETRRKLSSEEEPVVTAALSALTNRKVEQGMLNKSPRAGIYC